MKQFINTKETLVTQAIDGLLSTSGGRLARLQERAAPLHLDRDLVGAAVAEGLLDLACIDRPLQAQRFTGAFFLFVAHSSSSVLQGSSCVVRTRRGIGPASCIALPRLRRGRPDKVR